MEESQESLTEEMTFELGLQGWVRFVQMEIRGVSRKVQVISGKRNTVKTSWENGARGMFREIKVWKSSWDKLRGALNARRGEV